MKKTLEELINDEEKVLVNRGDMYMLLHSVAKYFYLNDMSEEWVCDTLNSLCARNHFPQSFAEGLMAFMDAYNEDEEKNRVYCEAMAKAKEFGFDTVDELIDFMNSSDGPES